MVLCQKGETATVIVPEVGADGYWYFVNKETGKLENLLIKLLLLVLSKRMVSVH